MRFQAPGLDAAARFFDSLCGHVEVGDKAHLVGPKGKARNSHVGKRSNDLIGEVGVQRENDDVGFHGVHVKDIGMCIQDRFQLRRMQVVLGQSRDVMLKRVQAGSGQHPRLTHAATHHFARPMGFLNERLRTHEYRAHGAPQAFAQTQGHAVKHAAVRTKGLSIAPLASLDPSVPHTGAVKVKFESACPAGFGELLQFIHAPNRPAAFVARVFNGDQRRSCVVAVGRVDVGQHVVHRVASTMAMQQPHRRPGVPRDAAPFVVVNVRQFVAHHFVSRAGVNLDRDLVGHGARWTEQGRLVPRQLCAASLQRLNALVLPKDVIPEECVLHGEAHALCGHGDGVASQVQQEVGRRGLKLAVLRGI